MKVSLPPRHLRKAGRMFARNDVFVGSAILDAIKLKWAYGLNKDSTILDIGCGPGRTLIGLVESELPFRQYIGVDVQPPQIDWANKHLSNHGKFLLSDARNARYRPRGKVVDKDFRLGFGDGTIDLVVCASLFTHFRLHDTRIYLREIARVLKPGGRAYITAFVWPIGPDEMVNPRDYPPGVKGRGSLLRVRLNSAALMKAIESAGLRSTRWFEESLPNYQTEIRLEKP